METLPEGFSFVSSDQPANALEITEAGRQVRIILLGPSRTVTYNMTASHVAGRHTIAGLFRDEAKLESAVAGDDTVEVLGDAGTQTEPSDSEGGSEGDDVGDGEGEGGVRTDGEGGVETEGEAGEGELEQGEQGVSDETDGELSAGDGTEDEDAQGAGADDDAEEDEEPAVVWTTAGTGGRADISRDPGTSNPELGAAGGEEFPVWLMLLLGLGGAIEVALIITLVRTRMWLALRV